MDEFEKLIRNGFVEIDPARTVSFEAALETGRELNSWLKSSLKWSKKSVSEDNSFILLSTKDERFYVEMRKGMTYFYNPLIWRVKSLENEDDTNRHDAGPDTRFQLKEFLMQEVNRAWSENDPCGEVSCEWDETSVHVIIKVDDEVRSSVTFKIGE